MKKESDQANIIVSFPEYTARPVNILADISSIFPLSTKPFIFKKYYDPLGKVSKKKNIKDRDFSLSGGGGQPHSLSFFLSFFEKFKQHF